MSNWSGYEYKSSRPVRARRDYRCQWCRGLIYRGELYQRNYGGIGKEHVDCPVDQMERERRGCEEAKVPEGGR